MTKKNRKFLLLASDCQLLQKKKPLSLFENDSDKLATIKTKAEQ
jgi:hypothetical protein